MFYYLPPFKGKSKLRYGDMYYGSTSDQKLCRSLHPDPFVAKLICNHDNGNETCPSRLILSTYPLPWLPVNWTLVLGTAKGHVSLTSVG